MAENFLHVGWISSYKSWEEEEEQEEEEEEQEST